MLTNDENTGKITCITNVCYFQILSKRQCNMIYTHTFYTVKGHDDNLPKGILDQFLGWKATFTGLQLKEYKMYWMEQD